jgi:hypothetical protein
MENLTTVVGEIMTDDFRPAEVVLSKPRSLMWSHFWINQDVKKAKCLHCSKILRIRKNTSPLLDHMKRRHRSLMEAPQQRPRTTPVETEELNALITRMLVLDLQPFTFVEDAGFRGLLSRLAPHYIIPHRRHFQFNALPELYNKIRVKILNQIQKLDFYSLTTDTWTSCITQNYMTVTLHFIETDWSFKRIVLETRVLQGSHTADALAGRLHLALQNWGLMEPKLTAIVSDNANNITAAIRQCRWVQVPCAAHTLQLSLRPIWKTIPLIKQSMKMFRKLVTYFHHSCIATEKLNEFQRMSNLQERRLVQDVKTRWNSTYDMLLSILESKASIIQALGATQRVDLLPLNETWEVGSQVCWVLSPFKQATKELSHERNISSSLVLPMLSKLRAHLTCTPDWGNLIPAVLEFRASILNDMNSRALNYPPGMFRASFLDPRFKRLEWISRPDQREQLIRNIENEVERICQNSPSNSSSSSSPNPSSNSPSSSSCSSSSSSARMSNLVTSFSQVNLWGEASQPNTARQEVQRYLYEVTQADKNVCPLHWWATHETIFPRLAILAKKYLCCPATSTSSERVFSLGGDIIDDKRSRLDPELVDILIFLHANMPREI